jgi:S1-C subfamily serine protease
MEKSNIILSVIIIAVFIQMGFIIYQHESIKSLNNEVNLLDNSINSLIQELGLTKTQLQGEIDEKYTNQQNKISELTADVIKTQTDLEAQSEQLKKIKSSVSDDFSSIIDETIGGVVSVVTDISQGSGFIITNDGYAVTNYHVIYGASKINILPYKDSAKTTVELVGYDIEMDLALLKISGDYTPLIFGNSDNAEIGEKVIAMGNPYGLSFSVTEGIISSLHRTGSNGLNVYIQTDVPLNHGNSGGPLIDKQGKVIGINNFKIGEAESLGFALESNQAVETINIISQERLGKDIL